MPVSRKTIELDFDEVTIVEDEANKTPVRKVPRCACGNIVERGGPDSLAGIAISEWPCCAGERWRYCMSTGELVYRVK